MKTAATLARTAVDVVSLDRQHSQSKDELCEAFVRLLSSSGFTLRAEVPALA